MRESIKIVIITLAVAIALNWFIDYKIMHLLKLRDSLSSIPPPVMIDDVPRENFAAWASGAKSSPAEPSSSAAVPEAMAEDQQTLLNVAKKLANDYQVTLADDIPKYDISKLNFGLPLSMQMTSQSKYGSLGSSAYTNYLEL